MKVEESGYKVEEEVFRYRRTKFSKSSHRFFKNRWKGRSGREGKVEEVRVFLKPSLPLQKFSQPLPANFPLFFGF